MPPVESEADRALFFDNTEFAQVATILGVDIDGYFDERTEFLEGISPVDVQTTNPTFTCQSSLIPAASVKGIAISIVRDDLTTFTGEIVTIEPDGFGMSLLTLDGS